MADQWESNFTVVDIQEGGAGNPYLIMPLDTTVSGWAGGGQSVTTRYGRDFKKGAGAYKSVGTVVDSDPERYAADLTVRVSITRFIETMKKRNCMHNLRVRQLCNDVEDFTNLTKLVCSLARYSTR